MKTNTFLPCSELHIGAEVTETGVLLNIEHPKFRHGGVVISKGQLQDPKVLLDQCTWLVKLLRLPCTPGDLMSSLYYARNHHRPQEAQP